MPFASVQVSGLWQYWQRNMQAVVQATSRMPGPSTAEPVVKLWRKPMSPVLSARADVGFRHVLAEMHAHLERDFGLQRDRVRAGQLGRHLTLRGTCG